MLEVYSTNIEVGADSFVPFNSVAVRKGCSVSRPSADMIYLNRCGVYKVCVDADASTSTTLQLYKDGVAQQQAQSTGTALCFSTLVQVDHNNCGCPCASPTIIQIKNTTAATLSNANVVITKVA